MNLPGAPIDLPLPPDVTAAFGYRGDARFVGFYWSPAGDDVVYDDGRSSGSGQSWSFLAYKRHRAVAPLLRDVDLGSSEEDGTHVLLIDRTANRASVAHAAEARAFLQQQHPPEPELTPEQQAEFEKELTRLLAEHRTRPIDHEAIAREMNEQRGRVGRMMSWLDMAPVPGQGQTPS